MRRATAPTLPTVRPRRCQKQAVLYTATPHEESGVCAYVWLRSERAVHVPVRDQCRNQSWVCDEAGRPPIVGRTENLGRSDQSDATSMMARWGRTWYGGWHTLISPLGWCKILCTQTLGRSRQHCNTSAMHRHFQRLAHCLTELHLKARPISRPAESSCSGHAISFD